jgi:hypothetical protein
MKLTQEFLLKNLKSYFVAIIVFTICAAMLLLFKNDKGGKTFFMMLSFAASFYAYHNLTTQWKQISKGILIGLGAILFLFLIIETIKAATSQAEWDFMCFYMQGQLGLHHLNFYDANSFKTLLASNNFNYSFYDGFKNEILNVGLLPPPISMLFFAPLASVDYHISRSILAILIFIFIFANTFLGYLIFAKTERSPYSFLFIFIIIMLLPGTNGTIGYNQTNFFILFFLLLTIYNINKPLSGFYLALSLILKPISGFLVLFFISDKKWKALVYFLATVIVLFLITAFFWGFQNIVGFFQSPATERLPLYLYEQGVNQSIIAVFYRNLGEYGLTFNMIKLIYYFATAVLIALTYIVSKRLNQTNTYFSFFTFFLCMLMIYPSSLDHYMVYLSPLFIYFLFLKEGKKYFWLIILPAVSFLRTEAFFSYLILWIALIYIGLFVTNTNMKEKPALGTDV